MMRAADATQVVVERFRVQGATSCASLAFEQRDMAYGLTAITDEPRTSHTEAQVLVRHNVDDEDLCIVYVDGPTGPSDDLSVLDAVIAVLQDARHELARLQEGPR